MISISTVLILLTSSHIAIGQYFGTGGGFGGFGCGGQVQHFGSECYQPKTGQGVVVCVAQGSSQYTNAPFFGDYGSYLAVDGQLSPGNSGFYHSNLEGYPWLKIQLRKPDNSDYEPQDITRVVIYQRCDANELYHQTAFEIKWSEDVTDAPAKAVIPTPRLVGGKYCATTRQVFFTGGTQFTVICQPKAVAVQEIYISKTTLHSHGNGWPGFAGNQWNSYTGSAPAQNSAWPVAFLMINEVTLY